MFPWSPFLYPDRCGRSTSSPQQGQFQCFVIFPPPNFFLENLNIQKLIHRIDLKLRLFIQIDDIYLGRPVVRGDYFRSVPWHELAEPELRRLDGRHG